PFAVSDREDDAELQARPILERSQLPALAIEFDGLEPEVQLDQDEAADIEGESRLDHQASLGGQLQTTGGRPVDLHGGTGLACQTQLAADFEAGRGANE